MTRRRLRQLPLVREHHGLEAVDFFEPLGRAAALLDFRGDDSKVDQRGRAGKQLGFISLARRSKSENFFGEFEKFCFFFLEREREGKRTRKLKSLTKIENRKNKQVLQGPGDVVFVPPAWWQCVENVPEPKQRGRCSRLGYGHNGGGSGSESHDFGESSEEEKVSRASSGAGAISINVNFLAGPVAAAAAWDDSVLRDHEEELRRRSGKDVGEEEEQTEGRHHSNGGKINAPCSLLCLLSLRGRSTARLSPLHRTKESGSGGS